MRIVYVEYSRLKSFGNYENERVGATAYVDQDAGETPEASLEEVKVWVNSQLDLRIEMAGDLSDTRYELENKRRELEGLSEDIETMESRWNAAKSFLERHGVSTDNIEEAPF